MTPVGRRDCLVEHRRRDGPVEFEQPGAPWKPNQPTASVAEGVDGAMVVNVDLGALAVELRLGAVARVREPAGIFQARGEHRGNPPTVATAPNGDAPRSRSRAGRLARGVDSCTPSFSEMSVPLWRSCDVECWKVDCLVSRP